MNDLFKIPYISSLCGYPGNYFSHDGKFEDKREKEYNKKWKLYQQGKLPLSETCYPDYVRPPKTMIEYLTENPEKIVDYMPYNHAIGMADIYMMYRGELRKLLIQPYYLTKKQEKILNSKVHKIKFYDYWHIHNKTIMEMITPDSVLGYSHLYHVNDRVTRVYFKYKNKFAYMIFPVDYLQYYGFSCGNRHELDYDKENKQLLEEVKNLVRKWQATGYLKDLTKCPELSEMAKLLECEPIQKIPKTE